jgi:16S rRNA (guanine966-N2)-methyltransferase
MRIIGGNLKGIRINPPKNLPVRPTTDMAKESLFNILNNLIDFEGIAILDLFSGTGNISFEFASRGAAEITCVDRNFGCFNYLKRTATELKLESINALKGDVFNFLETETQSYDLIFADPPYDLSTIPLIAPLIFERKLLKPDGILVIEHKSTQDLHQHPNFTEKRKYGFSAFSFFRN